VPLMVIVLAPVFLPDEHVTVNRLLGLAIGFVGVLVLFVPDLGVLEGNQLLGWLALIGSSISYAFGNIYSKRNVKALRPMIPALFQVTFAMVISTVLALLIERPIGRIAVTPAAMFAIVWLGVLGSGFAYLIYFRLLRDWGATRISMVAYILPIFGIALGAMAGEPITLNRLAGTALIIGGVALVNARWGNRPLFRAASDPARPPARGAAAERR
jgi:drug/metabolite transporter (DMT)-like permease